MRTSGNGVMNMRDTDMEKLDRWRNSDNGKTYRALCDIEDATDILTDMMELRDGVQCLREHFSRFMKAKIKLNDLEVDLRARILLAEDDDNEQLRYETEMTEAKS